MTKFDAVTGKTSMIKVVCNRDNLEALREQLMGRWSVTEQIRAWLRRGSRFMGMCDVPLDCLVMEIHRDVRKI